MLPWVGTKRRGRGEDTIIFDHERSDCRDGRYHRHCSGRRGLISKGYWPDGGRRRYKVNPPGEFGDSICWESVRHGTSSEELPA